MASRAARAALVLALAVSAGCDGYGALERWAGWRITRAILDVLRFFNPTRSRVPWDLMDLSDPLRPRVMVSREELERRTPRAA